MPIHLQDWMGDNPSVLWLMIIPILVAGEVLRPRRVFVSLIPAALVGAVLALIGPGLWWLQLFVAAAVAAICLVAVRPRLLAQTPPRRAASASAASSSPSAPPPPSAWPPGPS